MQIISIELDSQHAHVVQEIQAGIEATVIVPGRCETIDEGQDFGVVVDSADNPEALSRLLDSMRECIGDTRAARIFLIFGCKGSEREWDRPYMGEVAHYKVRQLSRSRTAHVHAASETACLLSCPGAGFIRCQKLACHDMGIHSCVVMSGREFSH